MKMTQANTNLPQKLDVENISRLFCACTMSKNISFDDGAESVASSAKEHGVANNARLGAQRRRFEHSFNANATKGTEPTTSHLDTKPS
jgi:hypothetical protein